MTSLGLKRNPLGVLGEIDSLHSGKLLFAALFDSSALFIQNRRQMGQAQSPDGDRLQSRQKIIDRQVGW